MSETDSHVCRTGIAKHSVVLSGAVLLQLCRAEMVSISLSRKITNRVEGCGEKTSKRA